MTLLHKIHRCDVCGKVEAWSDSWMWRIKEKPKSRFDDPATFETCSDECRATDLKNAIRKHEETE